MKRFNARMMLLAMEHEKSHHEKPHHEEEHHGNGIHYGALTMEEADKYVSCLVGADGTEGGHWTPGQISQIRAQKAPECDFIPLFATMNMLYSDYSEVAKKHGVDNTDFYVDMAKAFLEDPDGRPDKISAYIHCMGK